MTAVDLRPATWRDLEQLIELDATLFAHDAWGEGTWWAEFAARPRRVYRVAQRGTEIVGYAGLDCAGTSADVMTVAVSPNAQGQGLGRALMAQLISDAVDSGAQALLLEVRADNVAARGMYDSLGFAELTIRRRYYQPGDVDAVIMRKLLEQS